MPARSVPCAQVRRVRTARPRRPGWMLGAAALLWTLCFTATALGSPPRDYMLRFSPDGTFVHLDYFGTGMQLSLQHQLPVYGRVNALRVSAGTLQALALSQLHAEVRMRILFVELGVRAGYRAVWRNLAFEPGTDHYCRDCDRPARRELDPIFGRSQDAGSFGLVEPRLTLYFPFNDYFVASAYAAPRWEGRDPLSYDWIFTNIHDGGWSYRFEAVAFLKHHKWGGVGPYVQVMWLPRNGRLDRETAFGFNATMRLGLLRANDLLFLTVLARPGDGYYGQHAYYAPLRALLIYRMTLEL